MGSFVVGMRLKAKIIAIAMTNIFHFDTKYFLLLFCKPRLNYRLFHCGVRFIWCAVLIPPPSISRSHDISTTDLISELLATAQSPAGDSESSQTPNRIWLDFRTPITELSRRNINSSRKKSLTILCNWNNLFIFTDLQLFPRTHRFTRLYYLISNNKRIDLITGHRWILVIVICTRLLTIIDRSSLESSHWTVVHWVAANCLLTFSHSLISFYTLAGRAAHSDDDHIMCAFLANFATAQLYT